MMEKRAINQWLQRYYGQWPLVFLHLLAGFFCLGCVFAEEGLIEPGAPEPLAIGAGLALFLFGLAIFSLWQKSPVFAPCLLALFFLLGWLRYSETFDRSDLSSWFGRITTVTGTVKEAPEVDRAKDGSYRRRFVLEIETVEAEGDKAQGIADDKGAVAAKMGAENPAGGKERQKPDKSCLITVREFVAAASIAVPGAESPRGKEGAPFSPLRLGDKVMATGKLRPIKGYGNPGRIDPARQAAARGIRGQLFARELKISPQSDENLAVWPRLCRTFAAIRAHYRTELGSVMPDSDQAAIMAMLFGGYAGLDEELLAHFTATGIVHILSVSGSHLTLVAGLVLFLGRLLRLGRKSLFFFLVAALTAYALLAGAVPPVFRSAFMAIAAALALSARRAAQRDAGRILVIVCLALLVGQPRWLYDISFQLSFGATFGLIYLAPPLSDFLAKRLKLPSFLAAGLAVTASVHLATLPIAACYFQRLSLAAFIANLVLVPLIDFIIAVSLVAGLLGFVFPFCLKVAFVAASLTFGLVREGAAFLAHLPGATFYLPPFLPMGVIAYYTFISLVFWLGKERCGRFLGKNQKAIAIFALIFVIITGGKIYLDRCQADLVVHFIDVGQGNAALVVTPDRRAFLIDAGGTLNGEYDIGRNVVRPYLDYYGIHSLEKIFLTHAHADHAAGAGTIWRDQKCPIVIGGEGIDAYAAALRLTAKEKMTADFIAAKEGEVFSFGEAALEVIYAPLPTAIMPGRSAGNETSVVYRLCYGRAGFLFTGDLTKDGEKALLNKLADKEKLQASVLQVAHHGSKTSGTKEFLQAVKPHWAVISVGAFNNFGHPHAATLASLKEAGQEIIRTDRDGAAVFTTDGRTIHVETFYGQGE